jgi:hypothetical protein
MTILVEDGDPWHVTLALDFSTDRAGRIVVLYLKARPNGCPQRRPAFPRAKEDREMTTERPISRRTVLAALPVAGIVVAQPRCVASDAEPAATQEASPELRSLIEAHEAAYTALDAVICRPGVSGGAYDDADRVEQKALLSLCSYPAISTGDRRAKARYLMAIEERGELDLPEHMQAILQSMGNG